MDDVRSIEVLLEVQRGDHEADHQEGSTNLKAELTHVILVYAIQKTHIHSPIM